MWPCGAERLPADSGSPEKGPGLRCRLRARITARAALRSRRLLYFVVIVGAGCRTGRTRGPQEVAALSAGPSDLDGPTGCQPVAPRTTPRGTAAHRCPATLPCREPRRWLSRRDCRRQGRRRRSVLCAVRIRRVSRSTASLVPADEDDQHSDLIAIVIVRLRTCACRKQTGSPTACDRKYSGRTPIRRDCGAPARRRRPYQSSISELATLDDGGTRLRPTVSLERNVRLRASRERGRPTRNPPELIQARRTAHSRTARVPGILHDAPGAMRSKAVNATADAAEGTKNADTNQRSLLDERRSATSSPITSEAVFLASLRADRCEEIDQVAVGIAEE